MTTSALDRARQLLADPRDPHTWLTAPGQATALRAVIAGLVTDLEALLDHTHTLCDSTLVGAAALDQLTTVLATQREELKKLSSAAANVLALHRNSLDGSCSSCRIPFPCHTRLAITEQASA